MNHETYNNKELAYRVHKMSFLLERRIERVLGAEASLSFAQFKTLMALGHDQEICAAQIANYLGLTEAAISRQINSLVDQGYLERSESSENRRKFQLKVTSTGKLATKAASQALEKSLGEVFSDLSEADRHQFGVSLDQLLPRLQCKSADIKPQTKD